MKSVTNATRFFKFNNFIIDKFNFTTKKTQIHLNKIVPVDLLESIEHNHKLGEINFYFLNNTGICVSSLSSSESKKLYESIINKLASNNRIIEIND